MRRPSSRHAGGQVPVTATTARCGAAPAVAAGAEPVRCRTRGSSSRTARPAHKAQRRPPARHREQATAHPGPWSWSGSTGNPPRWNRLCAGLLTGR